MRDGDGAILCDHAGVGFGRATVVLEMQGLLDQAIKLDDHLLHVLTGGRDEK